MNYQVDYQGTEYQIEIPHHTSVSRYISVYRVGYRGTTGPIAQFLKELGKPALVQVLYHIDNDEHAQVILACGWKFSKSRAWRNEWSYLYHKAGGRNSTWGPCQVTRKV